MVPFMDDSPVYRATEIASAYDGIDRLPVVVLLDQVRSLYNVGSFRQAMDAAYRADLARRAAASSTSVLCGPLTTGRIRVNILSARACSALATVGVHRTAAANPHLIPQEVA